MTVTVQPTAAAVETAAASESGSLCRTRRIFISSSDPLLLFTAACGPATVTVTVDAAASE